MPTIRIMLRVVLTISTGGGLATNLESGAARASSPAVVSAQTAVAGPATATAQAERLRNDVTKPIFPMQVQPTCYILDDFGDLRSGGRRHEGTDILADRVLGPTQEVYAVVDGTLGNQVRVGEPDSTLSGNSWRLTVAGGTTWYAFVHLSSFAPGLSNGSFVSQGQLIGYVGDTGNPGPGNYHLHFEVHPNGGAAVNALTVLRIPAGCSVH
jgi:murein DD-endopeptidase MepM/ murein hydrolase activator NlpD